MAAVGPVPSPAQGHRLPTKAIPSASRPVAALPASPTPVSDVNPGTLVPLRARKEGRETTSAAHLHLKKYDCHWFGQMSVSETDTTNKCGL